MLKRICLAQSCFTQHQRHLATISAKQRSSLMTRLRKGRPDLKAIAEPRQALQWAQKVLQSRWKVWIHASKARYLSTSLFDLDAKQFTDLARKFVDCGSKGTLPSCQPSAILTNDVVMKSHEELVETIDRRLLAAFYDYALPNLQSPLRQLKAICQFSPITWFPNSRHLTRSIYVHIYNRHRTTQDALLDVVNRTAAPSTTIYCKSNTSPLSPSIHATCTDLNNLDYTLKHIPTINEMILDMDGTLQQQDRRWTTAFLDTPASTVHILLATDNHNNYTGWVERLEQIVKDRGEHLTIIDHQLGTESCTGTGVDRKRNFTQLGALQSWKDIQSGDCIVVKSRRMAMNMKDRLEHDFGFHCLVLFPQLPQDIQSQQIDAFNSTDSTPKVLVMTEMVTVPSKIYPKRLLLKSVKKQQHEHITYDSFSQLKRLIDMIGPTQAIMMFDKTDIPFIRQAVMTENSLPKQQTLCVLPSKSIFETFCDTMPKEMPMSSKMDIFEVLTDVGGGYILDNWNRQKVIADWLEHYPLRFGDCWNFMIAPLDISLVNSKTIIQLFGEAVSRDEPCELGTVFGPSLNSTMDVIKSEPLMTLVNQYHIIQCYHWFRSVYPAVFVTDETVLQRHQHQYQASIKESLLSNCSQLSDKRRKKRQNHRMGQLVERLLGQTSAKPANKQETK